MKPCQCVKVTAGVPLYCSNDCAPDGSFSVGRAYPSSEPFVPNIQFEQQSNIERFVEGWRNRSDKDKLNQYRRILQRLTSGKPASERKGWICPRCDNAVSPDEKTCPHCKPKPKKENADGERTHITEAD